MTDAQGISVALASGTYDGTPSWVRLDDPAVTTPPTSPLANANAVASWTTKRGRQYELDDKTQTGTASMPLVDTTGIFDPSNPSSPYSPYLLPLKQAKINVRNPVTLAYHDIFTGYVESWDYQVDIAERLITATLALVDGFELLTRAETVPDSTGRTVYTAQHVDDRIIALAGDAGWPGERLNVFTGNVILQQSVYYPQTSLLSAMQDAADAELPGAANVFVDKSGNLCFRGRRARANVEDYLALDGVTRTASHPIRSWKVGDETAVGLDPTHVAPIADIGWNLDLRNLINACLCYPMGLPEAEIAAQLITDPTSIDLYGPRAKTLQDLIVRLGHDSSNVFNVDAATECRRIGQYFVDNYKQPAQRISKLMFGSIDPGAPGGHVLWDLLCDVEIGDLITVTTSMPGGGGFTAAPFFVEGITNTVTVGGSSFPKWEMTLDVSPRAWFASFPDPA